MIDGLKLARDEFLGLLVEHGQQLLLVTEDEIEALATDLERDEARWHQEPPPPSQEAAHDRCWQVVRDWDQAVSVLGLPPGNALDRQRVALAAMDPAEDDYRLHESDCPCEACQAANARRCCVCGVERDELDELGCCSVCLENGL